MKPLCIIVKNYSYNEVRDVLIKIVKKTTNASTQISLCFENVYIDIYASEKKYLILYHLKILLDKKNIKILEGK